jgi:diamine N-acetyltransferase
MRGTTNTIRCVRTVVASVVTLREITAETVRAVCNLEVAPAQRALVAPNAFSIAQAHFEPAAWFRAICAGDAVVGFAMLYDPTRTATPDDPRVCFLWRFMIDARHQRRGYGAAAMRLLIDHVRSLAGVQAFALSYVPGEGSPRDFYARFGFRDTGEVDDGELVMRLPLQ